MKNFVKRREKDLMKRIKLRGEEVEVLIKDKKFDEIFLFFDGSVTHYEGKNISSGYGWILKDKEGNNIARASGRVATKYRLISPVAEWYALLQALRFIVKRKIFIKFVVVKGDYIPVIDFMNGFCYVDNNKKPRVRRKYNKYYLEQCLKYIKQINCGYKFEYIGRDNNKEADYLSKIR